ncbi:hypothetical protein [Legionella taurinensis]|uniref:Uncharacterized protein n=1 Tax=Legionella taurinensis TaxID=70611 RepID=A0A3A5LDT7_9GAMM|nr:hypothetical protein [Legionella taurinensis]RJT47347.1 hypothetical protein D6J04_07205 [Legionella taurinensis]RJT68622.1 hypothetical protein D6J03_04115 [Legionella taurinensis]STY24682.1 Uncharacterised protein [Legionella taurinensis]
MPGLNKESLQEWKKNHQNARQEKQEHVVAEQPKENPSHGEQVDQYSSLTEGDFETFDPNAD